MALCIDYGYDSNNCYLNTLQAVKAHQFHPVLSTIGEADITAHVDFMALKNAAITAGCNSTGTITQQYLLETLGIHHRAEKLCSNATPAQQKTLMQGLNRLIAPAEMGSLFKAIALTSPHLPPPVGFAL